MKESPYCNGGFAEFYYLYPGHDVFKVPSELSDEALTDIAGSIFPLKPGGIINHLKLKHPRYRSTAANGHFGREDDLFSWEKTDMVDSLKSAVVERN